jgi:hypothetical protein
MNVRGLAKVAAAATLMTMLPLNAVAAQSVRASQSLPSTTVAVAEDARAGAALPGENLQEGGFPWLVIFVVIAVGLGIYFAVDDSGDGPRSPNT